MLHWPVEYPPGAATAADSAGTRSAACSGGSSLPSCGDMGQVYTLVRLRIQLTSSPGTSLASFLLFWPQVQKPEAEEGCSAGLIPVVLCTKVFLVCACSGRGAASAPLTALRQPQTPCAEGNLHHEEGSSLSVPGAA